MKVHYRYLTDDGETRAVVADLQVMVAIEAYFAGKPFFEVFTGPLDDQLRIVHAAYMADSSKGDGETKLLFEDWRKHVTDFSIDGLEESSLAPLGAAELKARNLKPLTSRK